MLLLARKTVEPVLQLFFIVVVAVAVALPVFHLLPWLVLTVAVISAL